MPYKDIDLPVKGFIDTSFIDWKGHLSSVVFTGGCNFRCPYCFEKDVLRPGKMTDSTVNDIYKFIEKEMSHLEAVNITWYGGEPLLEMETICTLSKRLIELCKLNNVR